MGFKALSFTFDGKPSDLYNLYLIDFNGKGGVKTIENGSDVSVEMDFPARGYIAQMQGVTQHEVLQFTLTFGSFKPLDRTDIDRISQWLFGHLQPKKLQIIQDDMREVYYNCFLTKPKNVYIADMAYGVECSVICDAPFAYDRERKNTYVIGSNPTKIIFNNQSSNNDYLYPTIWFKTTKADATVKITNHTDNDYVVELTGLDNYESITMDSAKGIITSSTGKRRLGNTNYNFLRFLPNLNRLTVEGDIEKLVITYQNMRKVGG